jgi:hypothetical protein
MPNWVLVRVSNSPFHGDPPCFPQDQHGQSSSTRYPKGSEICARSGSASPLRTRFGISYKVVQVQPKEQATCWTECKYIVKEDRSVLGCD